MICLYPYYAIFGYHSKTMTVVILGISRNEWTGDLSHVPKKLCPLYVIRSLSRGSVWYWDTSVEIPPIGLILWSMISLRCFP